MSAHVMPELPDDEPGSLLPWLVAIVSGVAMLALLWQQASAIQTSLEKAANSIVGQSGYRELQLSVDGRDLDIAGTLPADADRGALVESLKQIPGMRVVRDGLSIHDPIAAARNQLQSFQQNLSAIDTSAIAFEPGSTEFTADSQLALAAVANLLSSNPDYRVRIAGHTDNTGRPAVNLRISRDRANAVLAWLQSRGVPTRQMIAQGYGHTKPIADNATEAGRARNRRIEFSYID